MSSATLHDTLCASVAVLRAPVTLKNVRSLCLTLLFLLSSACGGEQSERVSTPESCAEVVSEAPPSPPPAPLEAAAETDEAALVAAVPEPIPEPEPLVQSAPDLEAEPAPLAESLTTAQLMALDAQVSVSVGAASYGSLFGGVPLPTDAPGLVSNPNRPNERAFFGTVETVRALVRAAAALDADMPGSPVVINDIGLPTGGPITHHGSHQAGRDVDVLFHYFDHEGEVFAAKGIPLDPRGRGFDFGDLAVPGDDVAVRLDVARSWRYVRALLEDPEAEVQRIFVAEHLRTLLLAEANRADAPRAIVERFEAVTCQPGYPHDDHLHVRFFCTIDDVRQGCADSGPYYPWRRAALREAELDFIRPTRPTRAERAAREARTTSEREARAAAPRMHRRVRAWLDLREAWLEPPHPGRTYCR